MTYLEAIDELSALFEATMLDYEYEVLSEAGAEPVPVHSDATGVKVSTGVNAALKKAKAIIIKIVEFIKSMAKKFWELIKKLKASIMKDNENAPMTISGEAGEKVELPKCMFDPRGYSNAVLKLKYCTATHKHNSGAGHQLYADDVIAENIESVLSFVNNKQTLEVGKPIGIKLEDYQGCTNVVTKVIDEINKIPLSDAVDPEGASMIGKAASTIGKSYSEFVRWVGKLVPVTNIVNGRKNATNMTNEMIKENNKADSENRKGAGSGVQFPVHGESVEYVATRARLLEEAAAEYDRLIKLTEDAHSEPVPGTQKEIEDIPEETPVVAKEYPEDTSGGEGKQEDQLEATKELVDGDSKAMDLLTKNDQSKTITESIDLVFDL